MGDGDGFIYGEPARTTSLLLSDLALAADASLGIGLNANTYNDNEGLGLREGYEEGGNKSDFVRVYGCGVHALIHCLFWYTLISTRDGCFVFFLSMLVLFCRSCLDSH